MIKTVLAVVILAISSVSAFAQTAELLERHDKAILDNRSMIDKHTEMLESLNEQVATIQTKMVAAPPASTTAPVAVVVPVETMGDSEVKKQWATRNAVGRQELIMQLCGSRAKWSQDPELTIQMQTILAAYKPEQGLLLIKTCDLTDTFSQAQLIIDLAKAKEANRNKDEPATVTSQGSNMSPAKLARLKELLAERRSSLLN